MCKTVRAKASSKTSVLSKHLDEVPEGARGEFKDEHTRNATSSLTWMGEAREEEKGAYVRGLLTVPESPFRGLH